MLEKFNNLNNKDKSTLFCGIVVLFAIVFVLVTGFSNNSNEKKESSFDSSNIVKMINDIKDNYSMTINKSLNNITEEIIYYTDDKLELYESSIHDSGVIRYNNKLFCLDDNTMELDNCGEEYNYVNDSFYSYNFIKDLASECDYTYVSKNNVTCNISLVKFFEKYNNINNTNYIGNDENIIIDIVHNTKYITKINIDFSNAYNVINGFDDKFLLNIKFGVEKNDFSKIYDHYKDILEA